MDVIRISYQQRRPKTDAANRDAIRTCCSILFQWNTPLLAPIVANRFRWFSTSQFYVEDCEVCGNPIEISYSVQDDALANFDAKILE
jgi:hypothetical protein